MGSGTADTDDIAELDFRYGTPSVSEAPQGEDEVLFSIHGYTGSSYSVSQAETFQETARSLGWTETVTAVTWDDGGLPSSAESSARETGGRLATWLEDYLDANPSTTIRLLGHSMGGFVTMECVGALSAYQIENADMIGSYEEVDAPCEGAGFYDAIANNVSGMYNYHSSNDSIARLGQDGAQCGSGGWWGGGDGGDTPDNYYDIDVSDSVGGHTQYKSSTGCVQQIIDNHEPAIDRGGSGDDGGDDGSWW
jgi:pimeloyl-ACP methyl ester carboxylesterase